MRTKAVFMLVSFIAAGLSVFSGAPRAADIENFYGSYRGSVIDIDHDTKLTRDLSVTIKETGEGFNISWVTTILDPEGRGKTKSYTIDFEPTKRANVYSSAMKVNLFGAKVPLDPLKGDPFVWARHDGDSLTVHSLLIQDNGGYEMQSYVRKLSAQGLELRFSRIRNGEPLKTIETQLVRQ